MFTFFKVVYVKKEEEINYKMIGHNYEWVKK